MTDHSIDPPDRLPVTVASLFERSYDEYAHRPAVIDPAGPTTTYGELGQQVHRFISGLRGLGLQPGDRVLILLGNVPAFFLVDHALFVGGFVRSALSVRLHVREVAYIAEDCGARAIVTDPGWGARIAAQRDRFASVDHLLVTGPGIDGSAQGHGVDRAVTVADVAAGETTHPPTSLPSPYDPAAILYTSGTTGAPKGAVLSHANWVAMIRNSMADLPPVHTSDVLLHVAPLSHLSGYVAPVYVARGAAHLPLPTFEPAEALEVIGRYGITATALVPTMLNLLLLEAEQHPADTSSLHTILYGASPIAPDRLARAIRVFGPVFVQFYGLSETPMPLTVLSQRDHMFDLDGPPPERLRSAGRPSPFVELRLVDLDGNEVASGEAGEIQVRGDTVMLGYWGKPDQTREMIAADGWASTGDVGTIDGEGYVTIVDRKKDMIVTGGYNVYPNEIENVVSTLGPVQEVAVVGVPDVRWGEALKAVVVVRPGFELTEDEVITACADNLAGYKKPRSVEFVTELPKTGSGKIMRRALRDRYWENEERRIG
ncbi:AMP-binding protein [Nitriliruptoraceae bacterium ZYF776]|nr:AMP-binding protein [Profundirhabdus halotolerans]